MTDSLEAESEFGEPTFGEAKMDPAPGESFSAQPAARRAPLSPPRWLPVSYTHLTLPTNREV